MHLSVCAGGPDNQVHFEGYQVSNQCMALVRDECLLPCKDAPELGFAKESSPEQYVPDVFYKVRLHPCSNSLCWNGTIHNIHWFVVYVFEKWLSIKQIGSEWGHPDTYYYEVYYESVPPDVFVLTRLFLPPSIPKDKDKFGNDVTFLARPLPVEYLIIDVSKMCFSSTVSSFFFLQIFFYAASHLINAMYCAAFI